MSTAAISRRSILGGALAAAVLAGCGKTEWFTTNESTLQLRPVKPQRVTVTVTSLRDVGTSQTEQPILTESVEVSEGDDGGVVVHDLVSGKQLWKTDRRGKGFAQLPEGTTLMSLDVVTHGSTPLILGDAYVNPCPNNAGICHNSQTTQTGGHSVVALDGRTGKQVWVAPVSPSVSRASEEAKIWSSARMQIIGGTDRVVLVGLELGNNTLRTVALDPQTGKQMWSRDGLFPLAFSDTCVVVSTGIYGGEATAGASGLRIVDLTSGRPVSVSGFPIPADAVLFAPLRNPYLRDELGVLQGTGSSGTNWAVDLRRRKVIAGPERVEMLGRQPDGTILFAGIRRSYDGAGDSREPITELVTQAEDEQLPSVAKFSGTSGDSTTIQGITDGVIWAQEGAFDRSGRQLAWAPGKLDFVTDTLLVQRDSVSRLSVKW